MPQSLSQVFIHIVFSTKYRYPILTDTRNEMHAYLGGTCNQLACPVVIVGGVADHVHILCHLSRNISIADLVGDIKRFSSKWIKEKGGMLAKFGWQNGYGVFSVGRSGVDRGKAYIATQESHHRKRVFQDEFRSLLEMCGVSYDERYVWD